MELSRRAGKRLGVKEGQVQRLWPGGVGLVGAHQGTRTLSLMLVAL